MGDESSSAVSSENNTTAGKVKIRPDDPPPTGDMVMEEAPPTYKDRLLGKSTEIPVDVDIADEDITVDKDDQGPFLGISEKAHQQLNQVWKHT